MTELTPEDLALIALAETNGDKSNLEPTANDELVSDLDKLKRVVRTARDSGPAEITKPPQSVWSKIKYTLDLEVEVEVEAGNSIEKFDSIHNILPRNKTRSNLLKQKSLVTMLAVAAASIVGVTIFAGLTSQSDAIAISETQLASWNEMATSGTATLMMKDGNYYLEVTLQKAVVGHDEHMELWLIRNDGSGLTSLGVAHTSGKYNIPSEINPATYSIVDVSDEPNDNNPMHSSKTMCRGNLTI